MNLGTLRRNCHDELTIQSGGEGHGVQAGGPKLGVGIYVFPLGTEIEAAMGRARGKNART